MPEGKILLRMENRTLNSFRGECQKRAAPYNRVLSRLVLWFLEQDDKTKSEIIQAAFQGDERDTLPLRGKRISPGVTVKGGKIIPHDR